MQYHKTPAKHPDSFRDTLVAKKSIAKERFEPTTNWLGKNQSRIYGKGVDFFLLTSSNPLYKFIEIAHIEHIVVYKMTVEIFVPIVWTVFAKIKKSRKMVVFWPFWVNFGCFSHPSNTNLMKLHTKDQYIR